MAKDVVYSTIYGVNIPFILYKDPRPRELTPIIRDSVSIFPGTRLLLLEAYDVEEDSYESWYLPRIVSDPDYYMPDLLAEANKHLLAWATYERDQELTVQDSMLTIETDEC